MYIHVHVITMYMYPLYLQTSTAKRRRISTSPRSEYKNILFSCALSTSMFFYMYMCVMFSMPLGSQERRRKWGSSVSRTPTSTLPAISSDVLEVSCQSLYVHVYMLYWS